jgi:hypothetical protein
VRTAVARQFRRVGRRPWQPLRLEGADETSDAASRTRKDLVHFYQYSADRGDATAKVTHRQERACTCEADSVCACVCVSVCVCVT